MMVTCLLCGKEIGDHDPLVVIEHDGEWETLLEREPQLREREHVLLAHARCADSTSVQS
jgi:hypothetical protein